MNITIDELYLIIVMKEAELLRLKVEIAQLRSECNGWKAEAQRLSTLYETALVE